MELTWASALATVAYLVGFAVFVGIAAVARASAKENIKEAGFAFSTAAIAICWIFRGFGVSRSVFSGEFFSAGYWSWLTIWTFEPTFAGLHAFMGIGASCVGFLIGYAITVSLTLWNVPALGHSRSQMRWNVALFFAVLGLDYAWLVKIPPLFF